MALRAGYYGVKKSVQAVISNLSGAKIIKSIGDGLKLTSAGKLSCDIDTDTMEFKDHKLSVKQSGSSGGITYSTTEVNTGRKWIDGSDIYCITHMYESPFTPTDMSWTNMDIDMTGIAQIVASHTWGDDGSNKPNRADRSGVHAYGIDSNNKLEVFSRMGGHITGFYLEYTKTSE